MSKTVLALATIQRVGDDWRTLGPASYWEGYHSIEEARAALVKDGWAPLHFIIGGMPGAEGVEIYRRQLDVELLEDVREATKALESARVHLAESRRRLAALTPTAGSWPSDTPERLVIQTRLVEQFADAERAASEALQAARDRLYGRAVVARAA